MIIDLTYQFSVQLLLCMHCAGCAAAKRAIASFASASASVYVYVSACAMLALRLAG